MPEIIKLERRTSNFIGTKIQKFNNFDSFSFSFILPLSFNLIDLGSLSNILETMTCTKRAKTVRIPNIILE